jgi:hypothetical protein
VNPRQLSLSILLRNGRTKWRAFVCLVNTRIREQCQTEG